jgi:hypothetical protein
MRTEYEGSLPWNVAFLQPRDETVEQATCRARLKPVHVACPKAVFLYAKA